MLTQFVPKGKASLNKPTNTSALQMSSTGLKGLLVPFNAWSMGVVFVRTDVMSAAFAEPKQLLAATSTLSALPGKLCYVFVCLGYIGHWH